MVKRDLQVLRPTGAALLLLLNVLENCTQINLTDWYVVSWTLINSRPRQEIWLLLKFLCSWYSTPVVSINYLIVIITLFSTRHITTNRAMKRLTLQPPASEVLCANICPQTGFPDKIFSFFLIFLGPSKQIHGRNLKLEYGRFLTHPCQFIIHLSHHMAIHRSALKCWTRF
jgi:hypothetical protein